MTDLIHINNILSAKRIFKLPELVYQTVAGITRGMGTDEDKMFYMRRCLHEFIQDRHPGKELNVFMDLTKNQASDIHPHLEWGLYYTLKPLGSPVVPVEDLLETVKKSLSI